MRKIWLVMLVLMIASFFLSAFFFFNSGLFDFEAGLVQEEDGLKLFLETNNILKEKFNFERDFPDNLNSVSVHVDFYVNKSLGLSKS